MAARFNTLVIAWIAAFLSFLAAASYLVDPSGVFHLRNPQKPALCAPGIRYHPVAEPAAVEQSLLALQASGARAVVLGTSQIGIRMDGRAAYHAAHPPAVFHMPVYGASMQTIAKVAELMLTRGSVDTLFIGISYGMFRSDNVPPFKPSVSFDSFKFLSGWLTDAWLLMSPVALRTTLASLMPPFALCKVPVREPDGTFRSDASKWLEEVIGRGELANHYQKIFKEFVGGRHKTGNYCEPSNYRAAIDAMEKIAEVAARSGARLTFFTTPTSAPALAFFERTCSQHGLDEWKRDLARLAGGQEGGRRMLIHDFSLHAPLTVDALSKADQIGERGAVFYDITHFSPALGRMVMRRILQGPEHSEAFGGVLDLRTIEPHLALARKARLVYEAGHPDELAWIDRILMESITLTKPAPGN